MQPNELTLEAQMFNAKINSMDKTCLLAPLSFFDACNVSTDEALETATLQLEERLIRQALERCRWRRGDAAEALGLNLRTLQRKMKRLGMGR